MKRVTSAPFFLAFLCISFSVHAQPSINGTVTDAKTGETLPGVNVYLANTTLGSSTNNQGGYKINNIPPGVYILVFSFIGYKTRSFRIKIKTVSSSGDINVELQPRILEMDEVEVISTNKEWERNYGRFKKAFIGQTTFAEQTTIDNPWILNFSNDDNVYDLTATANEPLIIFNKALGYKLHVDLIKFGWSKARDAGIYKAYIKFDTMDPQNTIQEQIWWRNRIKAYFGSFHHFLKSLYEDKVIADHFSVHRSRNLTLLPAQETRFELFQRGVPHSLLEKLKGYKLDKDIRVSFKHGARLKFKDKTVSFYFKKKSVLSANTASDLFFVYPDGKLLDPASVTHYGNWARNRIANSLPTNYRVQN